MSYHRDVFFFFFQAEDGIRDIGVTGVQTCALPGVPFYVMKSNGGVLSGGEVVHQPITTMLSGPAAGALGAALIAGTPGFDRVPTCDGRGTSTCDLGRARGEPPLSSAGRVGRST